MKGRSESRVVLYVANMTAMAAFDSGTRCRQTRRSSEMETTFETTDGCRESDAHATVTFHANNQPVYAHRGDYPVATVKTLAGIPQADDLDELLECKLRPIPDDATIHIKGGEIFISHVKGGGSA